MLQQLPVPALALATVLGASPAAAATWKVDTNYSEVMFVARHVKLAKVRGSFKVWEGKVVVDDKDVTKSSVEVTFDVGSVNTDNETRDTHLKGADFFDATKFPKAVFKSTKVEPAKDKPNVLKV